MPNIYLSELNIYPVKSAHGIALDSSQVGPRGLDYDRRWMVVDGDGTFITQRQQPKLALIRVKLARETGVLELTAPAMPALKIPFEPVTAVPKKVQVWGDEVNALSVSDEADRWLSELLGLPCQLVFMPDEAKRQIDLDFARAGEQVGFADGFPFLLISQASLEDLNERLEQPLPMNRFRPNLVVNGCEAFAEDSWRRLRIGELILRVVKPCARCVITTTDQDTAEVGKEPLKTLATYRKVDNKVMFGQNLIHENLAELHLGDEVEVLE